MSELTQTISTSTLLFMAAFLILFIIQKRFTPFSFLLIGVIVLEAIQLNLEFYLFGQFWDYSQYHLLYVYWYLGFALTDTVFVVVSIMLYHKFSLRLDWASRCIMTIYSVMAGLQLIRFVDRAFKDTAFIETLYQNGIPLLNLLVVLITFVYVASSIKTKSKS
jgi:hypothetical protein